MIAQIESNQDSWKILEEVHSTNTFLLEGNFPSGAVCLAHKQNAGRGQRGRSWLSLDKKAFLFSALLRIPEDSLPILYLPVLTGVAVLQALDIYRNDFVHILSEERRDLKLQLKWPNDIYLSHSQGYGKLGGILIESKKDLEKSTKERPYIVLVLGVGLNWSGAEEQLKALLSKSNPNFVKEKTEIAPGILYINSKKEQEIPPPLSFTPYLVKTLNQALLELQNENFNFIDEARKNFFLSGRLLRHAQRVYRVKGLSEKCELLLEDIQTGKYKKFAAQVKVLSY